MASIYWDTQRLMPFQLVFHFFLHHFLDLVIKGNRRLEAQFPSLDVMFHIQVRRVLSLKSQLFQLFFILLIILGRVRVFLVMMSIELSVLGLNHLIVRNIQVRHQILAQQHLPGLILLLWGGHIRLDTDLSVIHHFRMSNFAHRSWISKKRYRAHSLTRLELMSRWLMIFII